MSMTSTSSTASTSATAQIVSTLGAGSGINTAQLAEQLAAAQFATRIDQLAARSEKLTAQISAASNLRSMMSTLSSSIGSLIRTGDLAVKPEISSPAVAEVTRGVATGRGTYALEVSSLAAPQRMALRPYASASSAVGAGTLTLRFGTVAGGSFTADTAQSEVNLTIASGATLADVAAAINASGAGISAYVANGAAGAQLVLRGREGAASGFIIEAAETPGEEGLANLAWTPATDSGQLQAAASNANFTIDGVAYSRTSNTINEIVPGVNLRLSATNAGNPATIRFSDPTPNISTAMNDLVGALNEVVSALNSATDPLGGPLRNDPGARALRQALVSLPSERIMRNAAAGEPATLGDLGLKLERNGTFTLDSARLTGTLRDNPQGAGAMWTTGVFGVFSTIDRIARAASTTTGGASLASSINRYTALSKTISDKSSELAAKQEDFRARLVTRFAAMDSRVSGSQSTLSFLKAQIDAWNASKN
ncbi:MAG: flagellar filament capping protein FliD [Novosphingobium sp.]